MMIQTNQIYNEILVGLKQLPTNKWVEVRDFVDFLQTKYVCRQPTCNRFSRFAGTLSDSEATKMKEAIAEGCEQIDASEW